MTYEWWRSLNRLIKNQKLRLLIYLKLINLKTKKKKVTKRKGEKTPSGDILKLIFTTIVRMNIKYNEGSITIIDKE